MCAAGYGKDYESLRLSSFDVRRPGAYESRFFQEYAFMQALYQAEFNVPTPVDQNRHCVLMTIVPGFTLSNINKMMHPERVYQRCLNTCTRLAQHGLIHGDLNEFNIMVTEEEVRHRCNGCCAIPGVGGLGNAPVPAKTCN